MQLTHLRICNFRCFGKTPTTITLPKLTFLIGTNGSGKTAVLHALTRLFGFERGMRRIQKADFHVPIGFNSASDDAYPLHLWLEADFSFPELKDAEKKHSTIPSNFAHMRLKDKEGVPVVRFRLDAHLDADGDIEEKLTYVLETDASGQPKKQVDVQKHDRASIQVHYIPARRDPTEHISYAATSLLGRLLRAADWSVERKDITELTKKISSLLGGNTAVAGLSSLVSGTWSSLNKGTFYRQPEISFGSDEIDSLFRHLTLTFSPGHGENAVDYSRLGDGQKSLPYLTLVLATQDVVREILAGKLHGWDLGKLQPPIFSMLAVEEPENSLSPHHLGRVVTRLLQFSKNVDGQALVATHSPALLRRIKPESIRYLRLGKDRQPIVKKITLPPDKKSEEYKYVREAVQAFPELYFLKFVILGEGASEEILIPRLFEARGVGADASAVSVAPLGGRHVNHFWRLLNELGIPHATLLDLDLGRYQGGWGRVHYAADQLLQHSQATVSFDEAKVTALPKWNDGDEVLNSKRGKSWIKGLETHGVFFSAPLDIDFAMLENFAEAYGVKETELEDPSEKEIVAVLGKKHKGAGQYTTEQQQLFGHYHQCFKLGSKPVAHLTALSTLDEKSLKSQLPASIGRLLDYVEQELKGLDE